ncbi:MAG TPA: hypothetical protein VIS07_17100 [Candidatus Binatia bacterium]
MLRSGVASRPWLSLAVLVALLVAALATVRSPERARVATQVAPASSASSPDADASAGRARGTDSATATAAAAAPQSSEPAAPSAPAASTLGATTAPPPRLDELDDVAARDAARALLEDAREARRRGDLRRQLALLQEAVELAPSVETHAALGTLYLELGASRRAEANLRAAAEGDPANADLWIALANALALRPDPFGAAEMLERARAAEPGITITRDAGGRLQRDPSPTS